MFSNESEFHVPVAKLLQSVWSGSTGNCHGE